MDKACAHMIVEGRVQGVYYRSFTRNAAVKLGLDGWVRNLPDGRVEAAFEGTRELIEQALAECRKGPLGARVEKMDVSWEAVCGGTSGFEIRY